MAWLNGGFKILQLVQTLHVGDTLVALTDNETTKNAIPKEMKKKGLVCEVKDISPGEWEIIILRK